MATRGTDKIVTKCTVKEGTSHRYKLKIFYRADGGTLRAPSSHDNKKTIKKKKKGFVGSVEVLSVLSVLCLL
jgi:hypothetical protein